jgi:chitin disaccharide deacetylase
MRHNPVLRELGFRPDDRVVIVHADDVGMCQATVPAFFDLATNGLVSAGSAMVPCPWFREAAAWWHRQPETDLGIHLTLTSEWDQYRWGPVTDCDSASGLIDTDGCFYRAPALMNRPDPQAALREMRAQVQRARDAGIDITHLDCHMFAMLAHGLADVYVALGFELGLPVLMTRQPAWINILTAAAIDQWEEQGVPVFDHLRETPPVHPPAALCDAVKRIFDELPSGLTYLIMHPAVDTPELRAIGGDWRERVAEYEVFGAPALREHARRIGIHIIGWRPIRQLMPRH